MVDLKELQKEVYQNKVNKGFNVTDAKEEFLYIYGGIYMTRSELSTSLRTR